MLTLEQEIDMQLEGMTDAELESYGELCRLQTRAILEYQPKDDQALLKLCQRIARDWKLAKHAKALNA